MHRIGDGIGIERIYDQRLGEILGGTGELRQHQHAGILVRLRGHELLGDQIHAVAQRRHHADPPQTIETRQS